MNICYCGNHLSYEECCKPYLNNNKKPNSAEALMRSRYSACATKNAAYLIATTHTSTRKDLKKKEIISWLENLHWTKLEILESSINSVTFNAYFEDNHKIEKVHHEKSNFIFENGNWFYVDRER
jgi:SEC-C motif-containing protein